MSDRYADNSRIGMFSDPRTCVLISKLCCERLPTQVVYGGELQPNGRKPDEDRKHANKI